MIAAQLGDCELRVEFSVGSEGVTVRETFESEPTHSEEQQRAGWPSILDSFVRCVETACVPCSRNLGVSWALGRQAGEALR